MLTPARDQHFYAAIFRFPRTVTDFSFSSIHFFHPSLHFTLYRASQKKVGFRICNSPVVWDDQRLTKLTDTAQQLPPPPATKNLEFPKRNRTSNFGFWPAPKILYAVRMSLRRYPKFYIFTFQHFLAVFGQNKIGHSKSS